MIKLGITTVAGGNISGYSSNRCRQLTTCPGVTPPPAPGTGGLAARLGTLDACHWPRLIGHHFGGATHTPCNTYIQETPSALVVGDLHTSIYGRCLSADSLSGESPLIGRDWRRYTVGADRLGDIVIGTDKPHQRRNQTAETLGGEQGDQESSRWRHRLRPAYSMSRCHLRPAGGDWWEAIDVKPVTSCNGRQGRYWKLGRYPASPVPAQRPHYGKWAEEGRAR